MTAAEAITAKGLASVTLPVLKQKVLVKLPQSRELARAGLLPLRLTTLDSAALDSDEMKAALETAEITMRRLVCECSYEPRIVNRRAVTKNQIDYEILADEDRLALYQKIMELASDAYLDAEPATESKPQRDALTLIAVHAKKWGLDPTIVSDWTPARFDELMMFSDLLDSAIKKAQGE